MATIEKRGNSYRIMASCGYDVDGTQEKAANDMEAGAGNYPKANRKRTKPAGCVI